MNAPVTIHAMLRLVEIQLDTWCEREERRSAAYRPPDFQLMYDPTVNWRPYQSEYEREVRAAIKRRRKVKTFAVTMGTTIAVVAFAALIFLPL